MLFQLFTNNQSRQFIDLEQIFEACQETRETLRLRFKGSMSWKTVSGHEYLYRKTNGHSKSLGPRSAETEATAAAFEEGRTRARERLDTQEEMLRGMVGVNQALRINRVPKTGARILRKLADVGLLDGAIRVAGTNALFAYEAAGAVLFSSEIVATTDVDLLMDARASLALAGTTKLAEKGLLGVLQEVDRTFALSRQKFRAVNDEGYMVDLIVAQEKDPVLARRLPDRYSKEGEDDIVAAEIEGLSWLAPSPTFRRMVVGEDGLPFMLPTFDPRYFALHKMWLSARVDREPSKRGRDRDQSLAVAQVCKERLGLAFDDQNLNLAAPLREQIGNVEAELARAQK